MARKPRNWRDELDRVNFRCGLCRSAFTAAPDLVEPAPEDEFHPWAYFADCPHCGTQKQPQAAWERSLLKAHQMATGPRTPDGLAATSANLAGHPTAEEALRTRFNAMKTGLNARVATYFPAKPDGYAFCARCDVDRLWCGEQPACVKQTELFMLHTAAFEQRNPKVLAKVHGDMHAALVALLQMCIQAALGDGAVIKTPKLELRPDGEGNMVNQVVTYFDGAGELHTIYEIAANPVFKPIADLVTRLGLSLGDLGMTIKANEEESEQLRGRLAGGARAPEVLEAFSQRMAGVLEKLPGVMAAAKAAADADPVLLAHQRAHGEDAVQGGG